MSFFKGLILIFGVLGSIYGGIATVTESAAIGAIGSPIVAAARKELTIQGIREALWATMLTTGSILWLNISLALVMAFPQIALRLPGL